VSVSDDGLHLTITGDASSLVVEQQRVIDLLTLMEADLASMADTGTATLQALTAGHEAAGVAATENAEAENLCTAALEGFRSAALAAGGAAEALGLELNGASEGLVRLTESFGGLTAMAVPLLTLVAAVEGIGAAFEFVGDGIKEAAQWQSLLASIGQAVKDQGGDWGAAQAGLEEFLKALEPATTYSQTQGLEAINSLVTAGISLADSERIVAVATDVAAAKHMDLIEVVNRIKQAEAGRAMGLVQLDENLRDVIRSHGTLSEVLDILEHDEAGQASAATETLTGKWQQAKNAIDEAGKEIGVELIPVLIVGADLTLAFAKSFEDGTPAILGSISQWTEKAGEFLEALRGYYDFALKWIGLTAAVVDFPQTIANAYGNAEANWTKTPGGQSTDAVVNARTGTVSGVQGGGFGNPNAPGSAIGDAIVNLGVTDIADKIKADIENANHVLDSVRKQPLNVDPILGTARGSGATPTFSAQPLEEQTHASHDLQDAQKALDQQLKALTASEGPFKIAVEAAGNAQEEANAKLALAAKVSLDAQAAVGILTAAIEKETAQRQTYAAVQKSEQMAADELGQQYQKLYERLKEQGSATKEETHELESLKAAHEQHQRAADAAAQAVSTLSNELDRNTQALSKAKEQSSDLAIAQAELERHFNEAMDAISDRTLTAMNTVGKSLEAQKKYWEQWRDSVEYGTEAYAKYAAEIGRIDDEIISRDAANAQRRDQEQQQLADEEATYGKSLQLQLQYYQARYAAASAEYGRESTQAQQYYAEILKLELDIYKQREEAQAEFIKSAQAAEDKLVDSILTKHQTLRGLLKSVWHDIESDYESMIASMISKSGVFTGLNKGLASAFGGGGLGSIVGGSGQADQQLVTYSGTTAQNTTSLVTTTTTFGQTLEGPVVSGITGTTNAISSFAGEAIPLLQRIAGAGAPGGLTSGSLTGDPTGSLGTWAQQYGATGLQFGSAAPSLISSLDNSSITSLFLGSQVTQDLGFGSGSAGGGAAALGALAGISGGGGGAIGAIASVGGGVLGTITGAGAAIGLGGDLAGLIDGGHPENSLIGGIAGAGLAAGAIAGLGAMAPLLLGSFAGPLGIAAGALIGAFAGGLFGPTTANPYGQPDNYNTGPYGQGVANLTGKQAGADGQTFYPSQQLLGITGGQSGISWIEEQLAGAQKITSGADTGEYILPDGTVLNPSQFSQYVSTFGQSATGGGQLNFGHNIGQQWITGAAGASSTPQSYQTLDSMLQYLMQNGGSSNPSIFEITRTYPNFTATGTFNGAYAPEPVNLMPNGQPIGSSTSGTSSTTSGSSTATMYGAPPISVTIQGNVYGGGDKDQFVQWLSQQLRELDLGWIAGAGTSKYSGNT
jgi:hypothetical protein